MCVYVCKHINKNLALKYVIHTYNIIQPLRKNKIFPCAIMWMDLESIMSSEVSQTEKEKQCTTSLTCGIGNNKPEFMDTENRPWLSEMRMGVSKVSGGGQKV